MGLMVAFVVAAYRRKRTGWLDPVLVPTLIVGAGSGLIDSLGSTGLTIAVVIALSMYGSTPMWLLRSVGAVVAIPVSVALSPFTGNRPIEWNSATVLSILPQVLLISIVIRYLYVVLVRQEQSSARESVLAGSGRRLLGVTDLTQARLIGDETLADLVAASPGIVAAVAVERDGAAIVVAQAGFASEVIGTTMPMAVIAALGAVSTSWSDPQLRDLGRHAEQVRSWRGATIVGKDFDRFLLTGGPRAVPDGVFDAFTNLVNQVALAEVSCRSTAELTHQAHHDHLTNLPTRKLFTNELMRAVDTGTGTVALLNIDLDDFKKVNDVHGHGAGDELLVEVARRLAEVGGPTSVPARFGGDEFALLLTDVGEAAEAVRIAEGLCLRLIEPVRLTAATVSVGASIGVAAAEPGLTAADLIRCADIAMYSAKARGKNRVERFTTDRHGAIAHHRELEEHLGHAVDRGELVMRYRPVMNLQTGDLVGVEALGYWQHPSLGMLPPDEFMPVAERSGHVSDIGAGILAAACGHLAGWSNLPGAGDLRVGVSVMARQVLVGDLADTIADVLAATQLSPDRLILQVIESEHLDDARVGDLLRTVAGLGVRIAVDRFGSTSGSLVGLRSLPIHQIKVDPGLLASGDGPMLQLVTSVGEILGVETVAAGENEPMTATEMVQWLETRSSVRAG
ncbi:putative bifunctional diguanylate cyclase/phosphodiesterase [Virgisporangium aurantiacum]|nr:diguanylate cyclase [Virgisporangium aurantiacum]